MAPTKKRPLFSTSLMPRFNNFAKSSVQKNRLFLVLAPIFLFWLGFSQEYNSSFTIFAGHVSSSRKSVILSPYYNELRIVDIKIAELCGTVDVMAFGSYQVSFTGKAHTTKPGFIFDRQIRKSKCKLLDFRFDTPDSDGAWAVEESLRQILFSETSKQVQLAEHDIIVMTDVDEIPYHGSILNLMHIFEKTSSLDKAVIHLQMIYMRYNFDFGPPWGTRWTKAFAAEFGYLRRSTCPFSSYRLFGCNVRTLDAGPSGIHLSSFYDPEGVLNKLASYSHASEYGKRSLNFTVENFMSLIQQSKDMERNGTDLVRVSSKEKAEVMQNMRPESFRMLMDFNNELKHAQGINVT